MTEDPRRRIVRPDDSQLRCQGRTARPHDAPDLGRLRGSIPFDNYSPRSPRVCILIKILANETLTPAPPASAHRRNFVLEQPVGGASAVALLSIVVYIMGQRTHFSIFVKAAGVTEGTRGRRPVPPDAA
jgi:hypothetical protein